MQKHLSTSIIIPTLGRPESLTVCLESIKRGICQPDEIILIEEEGELAALRNKGASQAKGSILLFIDDDVEVWPKWLESHLESFQRPDIVGASGPAIIRPSYRLQRDIFRFSFFKQLYDALFLERQSHLPGRITQAGTWTTGACEESCSYEGSVDYLEACNMAVKQETFKKVGGFDEKYGGIGDWSEPDLSFRIRREGRLYFNPQAKLYHNPARTGAFSKRKRTGARLANYELFAARWIKPHWRHTCFKWFIRTYYALKEIGLI